MPAFSPWWGTLACVEGGLGQWLSGLAFCPVQLGICQTLVIHWPSALVLDQQETGDVM